MSVSIITCFADICNTRFVQRQFRNEICMRAVYRCGKASMRVYHCAPCNIAVRCASLQRTRLFCRNFVQGAVAYALTRKIHKGKRFGFRRNGCSQLCACPARKTYYLARMGQGVAFRLAYARAENIFVAKRAYYRYL